MDRRENVRVYEEGLLLKARTAVAQKLTMIQAETFHEKGWHKADMSVHGTSGPLHTEPHDLAPISERVRESLVDQGLPYHADMFST